MGFLQSCQTADCCSQVAQIIVAKLHCLAGNIFICHKLAVEGHAGQEESDSEDEFSSGVMYKIGRLFAYFTTDLNLGLPITAWYCYVLVVEGIYITELIASS